jgi:plasmid stabilization system protein ParE
MSEVKWLPEAIADIERLHSFLYDKNPSAASRAMGLILSGSKSLAITPMLGRLVDDDTGRRELFVSFGVGSYVLRYVIEGDAPVVIRVWHSKEQR